MMFPELDRVQVQISNCRDLNLGIGIKKQSETKIILSSCKTSQHLSVET